MKFLIINGPNLNMLGIREPDLYGTLTYDGLVEYVAAEARRLGVEAEFYHTSLKGIDLSNSEISGIRITNLANSELRGSSVSSLQALELIRMLGIEIKD